MKNVLIAAFTLFTTCSFAQKTITWVGGTPGRENSWNEARNWSNYSVPNEFSDVIIPDVSTTTFSSPAIVGGTVELNSLVIESNAQFALKSGAKLVIYQKIEGLEQKNVKLQGAVVIRVEQRNSNRHAVATRQ